jgi:hypothetical protein
MMDIALVSITLLTYLAFASQKALDFWSHWYPMTTMMRLFSCSSNDFAKALTQETVESTQFSPKRKASMKLSTSHPFVRQSPAIVWA